MRVRSARPEESKLLLEIAIAAKSYWGYDPQWVRSWAEGGGFSPDALLQREVFVAELDGAPIAWAALIPRGEVCWLEDLWVEPAWIGKGIGTLLWRYAEKRARAMGARRLEWEAEPNAVGFYRKMGATYLRDSEESEWGRRLPVMGVTLAPHPP